MLFIIVFRSPRWQQVAADMLDRISVEYEWDEHGRMIASEEVLMLLDEGYIDYDIISWGEGEIND